MQRPKTYLPSPIAAVLASALAAGLLCGALAGCGSPPAARDGLSALPAPAPAADVSAAAPEVAAQAKANAPVNTEDIPRFAANSPFDVEYNNPIPKQAKRLWARSCLWDKAPEFVVEKWLTAPPETEGKYLLIEFWATWCSQCRRAAPLLNKFHKKYNKELVVIGVTDEPEHLVRNFKKAKLEYNIAIDAKARMKKDLAVVGIPHVIIVEPSGYVVWEGFPLLKGHELTEEVIERILAVGRNARKQDPAPQG